jgi:hypothetical protein
MVLYADVEKLSHQEVLEDTDAGKSSHLKLLGTIWFMADHTLCRYTQIESSPSVGNSYGIWQTLLYTDADKLSQQQVFETRMMYGRTYSVQMQTN